MANKSTFFNRFGESFGFLFVGSHIILVIAMLFSTPKSILLVLSGFLLFLYLIFLTGGLLYFLRTGKLAIQELIEHGLDRDSRQAIAICIGMSLIAVIVATLIG